MKQIIFILPLLFLSCGGDDLDIANTPLTGTIEGESWSYENGNGYLFSSDLKYRIRLLSTEENVDDPCTSPRPNKPHVSFIVSPVIGSYSLPLPNLQESAQFHVNTATSSFATSGFLEIFDVSNNRMIGYIQAQLDEQNTVEGNFEAVLCN